MPVPGSAWLYGRYLARRNKPRWCDKSLDSHFHPELLAVLYPRARFVCLYRHCMDVIASGIEACPWGVSRFGFDPYVAHNPGNNVAAIGTYWTDCTKAILAFENSEPERCFRVRYEDLVSSPEETAAGMLAFLGAEPVPGITRACFDVPHEGDGPGDEKIWFTTTVTADAIGRGIKVPAAALPDPLRAEINETLTALGYRTVDETWNDSPGPVDPRLPAGPEAAGRRCGAVTRLAMPG
jgi:protein-tyrosine sulfotransferase